MPMAPKRNIAGLRGGIAQLLERPLAGSFVWEAAPQRRAVSSPNVVALHMQKRSAPETYAARISRSLGQASVGARYPGHISAVAGCNLGRSFHEALPGAV